MSAEAINIKNKTISEVPYQDIRDAEIEALESAPTGAPMEARHWLFLGASGILLPIIILWWGWS